MTSMSREQFLRDYELRLQKEFELDGEPACWAPGLSGPRYWGEEDACIRLTEQAPEPDEYGRSRMAAACSPDEKYLAISLNTRLMIYDIETRTLRADIVGHEYNIEQLHFLPWTDKHAAAVPAADQSLYDAQTVRYLLFVQCEGLLRRTKSSVVYRLGPTGQLLEDSDPLPVEKLVNDAMNAMSADLLSHSDLETAEVEQIRSELTASLKRIEFQVRQKHRPTQDGEAPYFSKNTFSKDGQKCFFIRSNRTTQNGARPADDLPHIVVWDVPRRTEIFSLKGHTDVISWAGWAADDQAIVSASWDGTFNIWDAQTGECRHTIGPTGGQNWSGAISPDGQYVILSGGQPVEVAVYMVATGVKTATLVRDATNVRRDWIRILSWDPCPHQVAMEHGHRVLLMDADSGESHSVLEYERSQSATDITRMMSTFAGWSHLFWAEEGRVLVAVGTEGTICVWNRERNSKWRFQRPRGTALDLFDNHVFYLARAKTVLSVNADMKVRFWKL